jgi:hypothetical protein
MPLNMIVEITSGVSVTEVPDDVAADLLEAYTALASLPVNRQVTVDFDTIPEAKLFARQGRAWAESQETPLKFERKGDPVTKPTRVSFRIYVPTVRGPLSDETKAKRKAAREANRAAITATVLGTAT